MKKRFNFGRLSALTLALTLITTCLMGGTLAKYTSTVEGSGKATVAKWQIKFTANSETKTANFEFDLTDTGTNSSNVASKKVAPNSTGSIPIEIDADGSDVAAKLSYTIDKTNIGGLPIKFYSDEACTTELASLTEEKEIDAGATGDAAKLNKTIYWKWVSTGDAADTALGIAAGEKTIKITLKAEQTISSTP